MQFTTDTVKVACPYCGESFELVIDLSQDYQEYVEDCFVCCQPIQFSVNVDEDGSARVVARGENE